MSTSLDLPDPTKKYLSQIETPSESHVYKYPWAAEVAIDQSNIFWPAEELGVEHDVDDFFSKLNPAERHAFIYWQKKLTKYEDIIGGDDLWGGKVTRLFPRREIDRACSVISMVEKHSHGPFYMLTNQVIDHATDNFYSEWRNDPELYKHIKYIVKCTESDNPLEVMPALTGLEGINLFSAFGYFKSYNSRGHNIMSHFVSGIDGSSKDENFHSMFSAKLFRQCKYERTELGNHTAEDEVRTSELVYEIVTHLVDHEDRSIDNAFALDGVDGHYIRTCSKAELKHFVRDRANIVLGYLGYPPIFMQETGVISELFYNNVSRYKLSDFFANTQLQYTRNWAKHKLVFNPNVLVEQGYESV